MAKPVDWYGVNKTLITPKGETKDRVQDLPVFNNGVMSVSCWQLSPDELADIVQSGGIVFVSVWFGQSSPPLFVGSEETVRSLVVDFGKVWKK